MKRKILVILIAVVATLGMAQSSQYARRIYPIFNAPALPCSEGSVWYHMLEHRFKICTNNGVENVAVGAIAGLPFASITTDGILSAANFNVFNNKQAALGFTPENIANKNAGNGYAGLSGGKVNASQISEVIDILGLIDYSTTSGSGSTAIKSTINAVASGDVLTWNGSNWINQGLSVPVASVFGRTGAVVAQSGDYSFSQISGSATDAQVPDNLTITAIPNLTTNGCIKTSAGNGTLIIDALCSSGAITSLNGLNAATQTFADVDDTNVTLAIGSAVSTHTFTLGWTGTLADARVADILSVTRVPNSTTNGFIKTSAGDGTPTVDTSTYLTGNQTITLTGNVTGSGTTSISTTIANNVVNGAMIAIGSDAQGDILFYNGTDWARLPAGTSGQFLQTQGAGANPVWASAGGGGDMTLAGVQTVTGTKTFDPAKLIIGGVAIDPSVVIGAFYRDTDDRKLYWGVDDTVDFWGEVYVSGLSLINLVSNVTGVLGEANGGTGNSSWDYVSLTDGATITWTVSGIVNNATVTLGGNRTLAFSGLSSGMSGTIIIKQDATGSRTITLPAGSKVIDGGSGAITLSTAANAVDILAFTYDGTNIFWTYGKNYN